MDGVMAGRGQSLGERGHPSTREREPSVFLKTIREKASLGVGGSATLDVEEKVPLEVTGKATLDAAENESSDFATNQLPLSVLRQGEKATVAKVRGKGALHHHLENLGFVEGAQVKVVSESSGDLIVEIKGSQVALSRQSASRVVARICA